MIIVQEKQSGIQRLTHVTHKNSQTWAIEKVVQVRTHAAWNEVNAY
jgi:hypothetical protein